MSEQKQSRIIPNAYQSPNFYVDDLLPLLSGEEWKCMSFLIRKTLGWQKTSDRLAKSVIATATGLSEGTVDKAMSNLIAFGLALRVNENNVTHDGIEYAPQMLDENIKWNALEDRKTALKEKNAKRTAAARKALKIRASDTQSVPQTGSVAQTPSPVVAQTPSPVVAQGTQKPIKATTKVGADAPQPEWGIGWQMVAGSKEIVLPDQEAQAEARLANAVGMFPPAYQDLARAFITATGIFPLAKNVSGWALAFKDQISSTGLSAQDIVDACRQMRKDGLTIKDPFSIMNKVPDIRATRKASFAPSQKTAFEKALDRGTPSPLSEESKSRLAEIRARLNGNKPRVGA